MKKSNQARGVCLTLLFCTSIFLFGCPANTTVTTNENGNENLANTNTETNINTNTNETNMNMNSGETSTSMIDVKEPETYQSKINLNIQTMGEKGNMALPTPLVANVARKGENKRMEFNLPNGQKLVYLELGTRNLVILPDRKEYAELNQQSTGFEVRSLMTPGQIVSQMKNLKGVEKVGEEKVGGRDAVKYKYSAETQTNTKAGEVDTNSYVLVDKETGLPLRSEMVSQAAKGVNGMKGVKVVTEMTDISTDVSDDLFKEPTDYKKVEEAQIRQQIGILFNAATAIIGQMMQSANAN
ncbi:MAG: hypothetical protein ACR2J3_06755 [Aridibacter sp.]